MKTACSTRSRVSALHDVVRFLVAGGFNTLLTLGIYQFLLFLVGPRAAYALAWLCGLAFVALVYPTKVFGRDRNDRSVAFSMGALYVAVFLCGLVLLNWLESVGVSSRLSIFVVMGMTTAVNFIGGRLIANR